MKGLWPAGLLVSVPISLVAADQEKHRHLSNPSAAIVAFGASITAGVGTKPALSWPNQLSERLRRNKADARVVDKGIPGNRVLVDGAGASAIARFDRDVIGVENVQWVIFSDDPLNDIGMSFNQPLSHQPTAESLIAGVKRLSTIAHSHKIKFFCSTLTPYEGSWYWTPHGEETRVRYNDLLYTNRNDLCDAIIDASTVLGDPKHSSRMNSLFDSGDHLHPNAAGHSALADAVETRIFATP